MFQRSESLTRVAMPRASGQPPCLGVISDVALVRDGLSAQLARDSRVTLVGSSAPDEPLPRTPCGAAADVVVLDFGSNGARRCVDRLRASQMAPRIVGIAIGKSVTTLSGWAEAGVCGFVEDHGTIDDVVRAVLLVSQGGFCCSPQAAASIVAGLIARDRRPLPAEMRARLTAREAEILVDLERGATNKEIARRLGISGATVKNHVHHVLEKLEVTRRAQAAALLRDTRLY
jgi:two-component system, NarL family, nitrate/nitrite response regulator NarL